MKIKLMLCTATMLLAAPVMAMADAGEETYNTACAVCHGSGIAGAPKLEAAAWKDRLAKGEETLVKHAIEGFQGDAGFMPAKGGRADISDEAITAAVKYMIAEVSK